MSEKMLKKCNGKNVGINTIGNTSSTVHVTVFLKKRILIALRRIRASGRLIRENFAVHSVEEVESERMLKMVRPITTRKGTVKLVGGVKMINACILKGEKKHLKRLKSTLTRNIAGSSYWPILIIAKIHVLADERLPKGSVVT